jgi:hypothetical protein
MFAVSYLNRRQLVSHIKLFVSMEAPADAVTILTGLL